MFKIRVCLQVLVTQQKALNQVLEQLTTVVDALRQDVARERQNRSSPYHWLLASAAVSAVCSIVTISIMRFAK